jgi:hypothetical protein
MRILIIALGRSGGYQLNIWLSLELGYKMIHEPNITNESTEGDNIVVKHLITDIEKENDIDYKNWDKIIGLIREDVRECAISQTVAIQKDQWRVGYEVSDEWIKENEITIQHYEGWVNDKIQAINQIKEISLMVTYEGIYYTKEDIKKIKDYIGISNTKYEHILDNTNRLRNKSKLKRKLL